MYCYLTGLLSVLQKLQSQKTAQDRQLSSADTRLRLAQPAEAVAYSPTLTVGNHEYWTSPSHLELSWTPGKRKLLQFLDINLSQSCAVNIVELCAKEAVSGKKCERYCQTAGPQAPMLAVTEGLKGRCMPAPTSRSKTVDAALLCWTAFVAIPCQERQPQQFPIVFAASTEQPEMLSGVSKAAWGATDTI